MSTQEEEFRPETYYIPNNFKDAGGVLGGKLGKRNAIELFVICGPIAFLEFKLIFPLIESLETKIIIAMVSLLPLAFLCAFGIGGESLTQIVLAYYRFMKGRRTLHYQNFTDPDTVGDITATSKMEQFLTIANSEGFIAATKKSFSATPTKSSSSKKKTEKIVDDEEDDEHDDSTDTEEPQNDIDEGYSPRGEKPSRARQSAQEAPRQTVEVKQKKKRGPVSDKGTKTRSSGLISSATKQMLLRKLELGEDDDY